MVEWIQQHPRCALFADMGMGKTLSVLMAIDSLRMCGPFKALIIAPLRVAKTVWPAEVDKWKELRHLNVVPIVGNAGERAKAAVTPADIHVINYDNLPWLVELMGKNWPWRMVVADESTRLKSFRLRQGSKRAKALASVAWSDRVYRFVNLSGTPAPNGLQDLWGQTFFLDHGERLGKSFSAFIDTWFRPESPRLYAPMVPIPTAQQEINEKLSTICIALRAKDWFDLQQPIVVDVPVYLPQAAMCVYKDMEDQFYAEIEGKEVEALNAAAKSTKLLQLCAGAIYIDDTGAWQSVHDEKLDALESVIEESAGEPLLVAYHFRHDLARLQKRFPQGRELDKKESTIRDWNTGKIPLLFAHPASAGHGLNLADGGSRIVFFSHSWNLEERQQIIERVGPVRQKQAGHERPVYIYHIRAHGTIDDLVLSRLNDKRSVQDVLLEAAAARRTK